jgi:hypothetical protein
MQKIFVRPHRKCPASDQASAILRRPIAWQNFVVNPGNEGRIKTILPTGIDLDPGGGAGDDPRRDDRPGRRNLAQQ